jgi:hypothetical protein
VERRKIQADIFDNASLHQSSAGDQQHEREDSFPSSAFLEIRLDGLGFNSRNPLGNLA